MIFSFDLFGWSSSDPGDEHEDMAVYFLSWTSFPYMTPYRIHFDQAGLDADDIIDIANIESYPPTGEHWRWEKVDTLNDLVQLPLTSNAVGAIIHAGEDSGVPANHRPGAWEWDGYSQTYEDNAERIMEHNANYYGYYAGNPALAYNYVLKGNWFDKMDTYLAESATIAATYRNWYLSHLYNREWLGLSSTYIIPSLRQSLRFTQMLTVHFLDYYELSEPGSTIAHWEFEENALNSSVGHIAVNSKGSNPVNLQYGSSITSVDVHDPTWVSGPLGQAIHCKGWTEAGNNCTYARQTGTWTVDEMNMLAPYSSYSIEVVFNVENYISSTTDPNRFLGILTYRDDDPTNAVMQYRIRTYKENVSGTYRTFVDFYANHPGGSSTSIAFNTDAAGLPLIENKWYYLAAIFHYETSTMDLIVRDMANGKTVSTTASMGPTPGFTGANPSPVYLIGSSSYSSGKCFDGLIDDVRVSNRALNIDAERLYNSTLAHWRFDEGTGQTVYNTQGVAGANLQLGLSGADVHDPDWDDGYWGKSLHGEGYVQNGNVATYAIADPVNGYVWPLVTSNALVPLGSYTIEAIFNLEEYPTSGTTTMGIIDYSDYIDSSIRYRIITYLSGSNTCIQYQSGNTIITWDTTAAGMTITPGKWYYIAALFNDSTDKIDLVLRDMQSATGASISNTNNTMQNMVIFSGSPRPILFIGTDTFNSKSFDGRIDEVRISNSVLPEKDRLYMHGSTIAHWKFDYDYATAGQVIDNVDNDILLNLQLGWDMSPSPDDPREPILEPTGGWYGGAMHCKGYIEAGNNCTYARTRVWDDVNNPADAAEIAALRPTASYSIETIFNIDAYPADGSSMGILRYREYGGSNRTLYLMKTYKQDVGGTLHTFIAFYGSGTTVSFDTQAAGLTLNPDNWYYFGAFFNSATNKVDLYVRDLESGTMVSKVDQAMNPLLDLTGGDPLLMIGSETSSTGSCFDGLIDGVRISNQYLPADCRLYNLPR